MSTFPLQVKLTGRSSKPPTRGGHSPTTRPSYDYRRAGSPQSSLLERLRDIDSESLDQSPTNPSVIRSILECTYEIVRWTFITLDNSVIDVPESAVKKGVIALERHLARLPVDSLTRKENQQVHAILTFVQAVEDYDSINREVLPRVHTEDIDRRNCEVTLEVHKAFVNAELEIYGQLSQNARPRLMRNALSCIVAGSLYKIKKPYKSRVAVADALAAISGAELAEYRSLKKRLLNQLRSTKSRSKRKKVGLRFIAKKVPMLEGGDLEPEEEMATGIM
ncbi:uncharacterized protein CLAFUR5_09956 [Fulvia fulva]|uniref:Uncharacterized protein n=1 Tax=Passalora fulva TaxID=5499 RepID=A0A9Q8PCW6_PASFU|nr:uncharacterized protein CLAFUR5_09956 [Fulvia fulva]UJO20143.1 hypothetical protein CLAFUR5_09956 [Fulvia fulva]